MPNEPPVAAEDHHASNAMETSGFAGVTASIRRVLGRILQTIGSVLKSAGKMSLLPAMSLLVVWGMGRIMEAIHGNVIFDLPLSYWLGLAVFVLLSLWFIGYGMHAMEDLTSVEDKGLPVICWIFFGTLIGMVLYSLKGYRLSAEGLFAAMAGSAESAWQSAFLLLKFHALNPMLGLNLAASKFVASLDIEALAPYLWSWNALFAFFIWSVAYGIVILMQRDRRFAKSVHLVMAVCGLLILIAIKSISTPTIGQMIIFQAAIAILLVLQILLAYATVREMAALPVERGSEFDGFETRSPEKAKSPPNRHIGLPPSATKLALVLFLVVPLFSDLQNRFVMSYQSNRIMRELSTANHTGSETKFVAVTAISIRNGPAAGDEIQGVLPKGTTVQVLDRKNGWVNIGDNKWIPEKFLRPVM